MNINKVMLTGRLTKDWELSFTKSGTAVAKNTIAVNRMKKDETDFINIIVWNNSAEFISEKTMKGNRIELVGRIQTGSYTNKEGKKVYTTDVVTEEINPVDWATDNRSENKGDFSEDDMNEVPVDDGDIPF